MTLIIALCMGSNCIEETFYCVFNCVSTQTQLFIQFKDPKYWFGFIRSTSSNWQIICIKLRCFTCRWWSWLNMSLHVWPIHLSLCCLEQIFLARMFAWHPHFAWPFLNLEKAFFLNLSYCIPSIESDYPVLIPDQII